jgi:hypothetical protein
MNGFIRADGKRLLDGRGRPFQIRGVNLGNWLVLDLVDLQGK